MKKNNGQLKIKNVGNLYGAPLESVSLLKVNNLKRSVKNKWLFITLMSLLGQQVAPVFAAPASSAAPAPVASTSVAAPAIPAPAPAIPEDAEMIENPVALDDLPADSTDVGSALGPVTPGTSTSSTASSKASIANPFYILPKTYRSIILLGPAKEVLDSSHAEVNAYKFTRVSSTPEVVTVLLQPKLLEVVTFKNKQRVNGKKLAKETADPTVKADKSQQYVVSACKGCGKGKVYLAKCMGTFQYKVTLDFSKLAKLLEGQTQDFLVKVVQTKFGSSTVKIIFIPSTKNVVARDDTKMANRDNIHVRFNLFDDSTRKGQKLGDKEEKKNNKPSRKKRTADQTDCVPKTPGAPGTEVPTDGKKGKAIVYCIDKDVEGQETIGGTTPTSPNNTDPSAPTAPNANTSSTMDSFKQDQLDFVKDVNLSNDPITSIAGM